MSICTTLLAQSKVPPPLLGYAHVGKLVYITEEGEILINPSLENTIDEDELQQLSNTGAYNATEEDDSDDEEQHPDHPDKVKKRNEKYEKMISLVPRPLKDHMPDFYLKPLVALFEKEQRGEDYLQ